MDSQVFNWFKAPAILGVDGYRIVRIKEDANLAANKAKPLEFVIGSVGADKTSFEDAAAFEDRTAYHYCVLGMKAGKVVVAGDWDRIYRRRDWGVGPKGIMVGDEKQGFCGVFSTDVFDVGASLSTYPYQTDRVAKMIRDGKIYYIPYIGLCGMSFFLNTATGNSFRNMATNAVATAGKSKMIIADREYAFNAEVSIDHLRPILPHYGPDGFAMTAETFGGKEVSENFGLSTVYLHTGTAGVYHSYAYGANRTSGRITQYSSGTSTSQNAGLRFLGMWLETDVPAVAPEQSDGTAGSD